MLTLPAPNCSPYSFSYLPPVKPSAIALGTVFTHATNLAVMSPLFGETYRRAKAADSKEEFLRSKESATAAVVYGSSLAGSAVQTYALAALLNATGTLSYRGAAWLGGMIFAVTSVPIMITQVFQERRPVELIAVKAAAGLIETLGLSVVLTWWGTRTHAI